MKELDKRVKKLKAVDIGLIKLAVVAGVLFIIAKWSAVLDLVLSVNPWYFLVAFVILAARPAYKFLGKK
jgi:hypothetical protein